MLKIKKEIYNAIIFRRKNPNISITKISEQFNIDRHTLSKYENFNLDNLIFSKHFNCYIFFDENEKLAIDEYLNTNISYAKIREKYGYKQERMIEKLLAVGADTERKYKVNFNRNVFEEIETEEDAYILGFILADGYINEERNCLQLKLNKKDEDILEKINKYFKCSAPIKYTIHNITKNELCYIQLNSKKLIYDLKKYNLFQGKSGKEIPFYDIDINLLRHYIRGLFDGDGYICKNSNRMGICGSKDTLEFIHNHLIEKLKLEFNSSRYRHVYYDELSHIYRLYYTGINALKVMDYLYKDSNIYLNRKYNLVRNKLNGCAKIEQNR